MKQFTISGKTFEIDEPYAEGHVCSPAEAKTLNQTRAENVRNNLAKHIKTLEEAGSVELDGVTYSDGQALVTAYAKDYEFSMGGGGTARVVDPVEREAIALAKAWIKEQLADIGKTVKEHFKTDTDAGKERYASKVAEVAEQPEVRKEAEKAVAAQKKRLADLSGAISLDTAA